MQELGGSIARLPKVGNGNIPYNRCHAQFIKGDLPQDRNPLLFFSCLFFPWVQTLSDVGVWTFSGSSVFFRNFTKFVKSMSPSFHNCCSGIDCELVIRWWENCVVYSLFFIIITVIIIISSSSSSISFFVLLNCVNLNPRVLPFVDFFSPSHWGEEGEGLSSA